MDRCLLRICCMLFVFCAALPADLNAADPKKPAPKVRWKDMPMVRSKEYKRFDRNNDGVLDAAEKEAIRKTFKANPTDSYLLPYDRDGDKQLSDKEIAGIPAKEIDQAELAKRKTQSKGKKK